jgi:hypothetical protein
MRRLIAVHDRSSDQNNLEKYFYCRFNNVCAIDLPDRSFNLWMLSYKMVTPETLPRYFFYAIDILINKFGFLTEDTTLPGIERTFE